MADQPRHRVVIVGGGFGGLPATRLLARSKDVEVTLLDRRNHHLFQLAGGMGLPSGPGQPAG